VTRNLSSFSSKELEKQFNLNFALEWGLLPLVVLNPEEAADILSAYVHTYIKEEIKEEGLVRKLDPFLRFLEVAGLVNGQQVNMSNIARDARVPRASVEVYFSILEDTLLAHKLDAYRPGAKVREQGHPKYYWFDSGVARGAAGLLRDSIDSIWLGQSLETLIFHELRIHNHVSQKERPLFYYRTGAGGEIDFIVETKKKTLSSKPRIITIEVKYSKKWDRRWESPMRSIAVSGSVHIEKMFGVYMGKQALHFEGVDVLPVETFLSKLHEGEIF
jgi:predicted AAA+ superfamily ATPase